MNPYIFLEVWSTLKVVVWLYGLTGSYLPLGIIWLPLSNSHCVSLALLLQPKFLALYWASVIKCGQLRFAADKNTFSFPQTRQGSLWMCCAFPLACCGMFFLLLVSLRPRSWGGYWNFVRELSDLLKIYVNFVFSSIYVLYVLHILICACSHILESRNKNNFIMADDLFNMQMNSFSKYLWMNSVFISIKDIVL